MSRRHEGAERQGGWSADQNAVPGVTHIFGMPGTLILWTNKMLQIASDTPLFEVVGARVPALRRLEKMGIKTVRDLLWHFPVRYEDYSKIYTIAELEPGQQATIQGIVEEVHARRSYRRAMNIVEAVIADETGSVRAVWFNQPYLANVLKTGRTANFSGKVSVSEEGELYLSHPAHEMIRGDAATQMKHTGRLVPVYPETRGLTSRGIRFIVQSIFKRNPGLIEWIPEPVLAEFHFPEIEGRDPAHAFPARSTKRRGERSFLSKSFFCSIF